MSILISFLVKDIMQGFVRANVPIDKAFEVIHDMYPSHVSKEFDVVEYEYEESHV